MSLDDSSYGFNHKDEASESWKDHGELHDSSLQLSSVQAKREKTLKRREAAWPSGLGRLI